MNSQRSYDGALPGRSWAFLFQELVYVARINHIDSRIDILRFLTVCYVIEDIHAFDPHGQRSLTDQSAAISAFEQFQFLRQSVEGNKNEFVCLNVGSAFSNSLHEGFWRAK